MDLTPELLGTAAVGLIVIIGAIGNYLRALRRPPPNPVLSGVGGGLAEHEQMERLIFEMKRIADALTDKNTSSINSRLEELADAIDHMKSGPPRRRS